ncbi:hypothetical protein JCM18899A_09530 [Nocardioides sp. AN3]
MRYATIELPDGTTRLCRLENDTLQPLRGFTALDSNASAEALGLAELDDVPGVSFNDARFAPVCRPEKILCVGLNYRAHVEEAGRDMPSYPVLFPKFASNLVGHQQSVQLPPESAQVDYEAELAVVIGDTARRVGRDSAMKHVLGYTIANDITMRDYQYKTHQWMQGKAWDNSTPLGPILVTPDEIDPANLNVEMRLNGAVMQSSNTERMIFDIPTLVATVSEFTELNPGDVILTGTPSGVGYRRDPQVFLSAGDVLEVEIEGLGVLSNDVVAEPLGRLDL